MGLPYYFLRDCASERMTHCCCTVQRCTVAQSYAKKFHFRFPFGFAFWFEFEFQQQKQRPQKKGGTKSSQAALLALYLARERERGTDGRTERERSFVESETSVKPNDPPSVYVITEMADWEREWRRRPGQRRRLRQRQRDCDGDASRAAYCGILAVYLGLVNRDTWLMLVVFFA